jgi:hypothetical protein
VVFFPFEVKVACVEEDRVVLAFLPDARTGVASCGGGF